MKNKNLKQFVIELKNLIRNNGRTNVISISEIDELFVKHNINVGDLEDDR